MSNTTDAILLESPTGDQNASKSSSSYFRISGGRLVFSCNKVRSVAVGSGTHLSSAIVVAAVLLNRSCDARPPSNIADFEAIELMKLVCRLLRLCILGPSPMVPGLDIFDILTEPTLMKCWLLENPPILKNVC